VKRENEQAEVCCLLTSHQQNRSLLLEKEREVENNKEKQEGQKWGNGKKRHVGNSSNPDSQTGVWFVLLKKLKKQRMPEGRSKKQNR